MTIPFRVFEPDYSNYFPKHVWCVRCEDWIPFEEAYGGPGAMYDPHVMDHVHAWQALRNLSLATESDENHDAFSA